jgi:hypothetical protein
MAPPPVDHASVLKDFVVELDLTETRQHLAERGRVGAPQHEYV